MIASHGGTARMILSILFNLPLHQTSMFDVDYASLTTVEFLPHRTEIQLLNLTPWRDL
jgi:broad specificity phosphatase PhoE